MEGTDIEIAIRDIQETSVVHLEPDRIKGKPTVSDHTVPKSQWIIAMPNTSGNKIFILLPSSSSAFTLLSYSLFCYLHHHSPLPYYPIPYSVTFIIIHLYPIILFLILLPS